MWEKKKIVAILIVISLIIFGMWYFLDKKYVSDLPTGLYYNYTYDLYIENISSEFEIIVPIPILENGTVFPYFGNVSSAYANIEIVSTSYGPGLKITGQENLWISLRGAYDAIENSSDYRSDGIPILSMSTFNHTDELYDYEQSGNAWIFSNVNGIDLQLEFNSIGKSWKIDEGTFHSGYVRGGTGYGMYILNNTQNGWHQYYAESGIVSVE